MASTEVKNFLENFSLHGKIKSFREKSRSQLASVSRNCKA